DGARGVRLYAPAFRRRGMDLAALPPEEAAARIRRTSVAVELAAILDHWADQTPTASRPGELGGRQLAALAPAAGPGEGRGAGGGRDGQTLRRRAGPAAGGLPRATLALAGAALGGEPGLAFLREAHRLHPDDFWINQQLSWGLTQMQPPRWEEALPYALA